MDPVQVNNAYKRILIITLLLIFLSTFFVTFIGKALLNVHADNKSLNEFLLEAEDSQPNFEKSLEIYTDSTEAVIDYLLTIRPGTKEEYIKFISSVENIGQELSLNIDLDTLELDEKDKKIVAGENSISYSVRFFGSYSNLRDFIKAIEKLPYLVKFETISYQNPTLLDAEHLDKIQNIKVDLKLFTK